MVDRKAVGRSDIVNAMRNTGRTEFSGCEMDLKSLARQLEMLGVAGTSATPGADDSLLGSTRL